MESATCASWGVERLATAWVGRRHLKVVSVGVGWSGCTRSMETKARAGVQIIRATFALTTENNNKMHKNV